MKVRLSKCSISELEVEAVSQTLRAEYLGMGENVKLFEHNIKSYLGTDLEVTCVNTGTSALQLALSALDIGPGDEVLVPSLTYVASFQAISATGAIPVACDVSADTLFMCPIDAENKITKNTKALLPVLHSSSAKGCDAAQAFGSLYNGKKIGTSGDVVCFSFDGIKNITCAEGGAILTSDKILINRLKDGRLLGVEKDTNMRFSGQRSWDFDVCRQGFRFHMSNINAAIGIQQLKRIEAFKSHRQNVVRKYLDSLAEISAISFFDLNYNEIMPHIFVIKAESRNLLRNYLIESGIECGIHYKPNHLLTLYNIAYSLPITEKLYEEILTLPCHAEVTDAEQNYVICKIKEFYAS